MDLFSSLFLLFLLYSFFLSPLSSSIPNHYSQIGLLTKNQSDINDFFNLLYPLIHLSFFFSIFLVFSHIQYFFLFFSLFISCLLIFFQWSFALSLTLLTFQFLTYCFLVVLLLPSFKSLFHIQYFSPFLLFSFSSFIYLSIVFPSSPLAPSTTLLPSVPLIPCFSHLL